MEGFARLRGPGWGQWRGGWQSSSVLFNRGAGWEWRSNGSTVDRWPTFEQAVAELWPRRTRTGAAPWALGWSGYEACAEAAGVLPVKHCDGAIPQAWWLLEPVSVDVEAPTERAPALAEVEVRNSLEDEDFSTGVERIRSHIEAGDVYQVNLTRRFTVEGWGAGLAPLAAVAGDGGDPDYLSSFSFDGGEILCASMELLCRRRGRRLETRPIKGTRGRGSDRADDCRLVDELGSDPKELAELAMIVDLERNDLGRIAEPGTVRVADPGKVVTYPGVHHRVARVTAELADGVSWWQTLAAVAPGGSVTGCPKIAAMSVIARLERAPRGPYTGALGVISGNGDMEVALPIRTAWCSGETLAFAAGCGIVWESDPIAEELESRLKVARWLALVEGGTA